MNESKYKKIEADDRHGKTLAEMIEEGDWESAQIFCGTFPEKMKELDPVNGATVLHRLCTKPPTPIELYEVVLTAYPEAVRIQERKYMATPLHILSWTSQRTTGKVDLLLRYMTPSDLELRNQFGGTALHSSCGSQASLSVIKLILQKNPSIVNAKTYEYSHTALTALWQSHLQSIQGHLQIARIIKGETVNEGHFDRFWEKLSLLATEAVRQSYIVKDPDGTNIDYSSCGLQGLLILRAPINAIKVAIRKHPEWACFQDVDGNYPLHNIIINRPFRLKDVEVIKMLLNVYADAAKAENASGKTPVFLAIRDRMPWDEGLGEIIRSQPELISSTDKETGLYPFLMAASLNGRVATNTTYQLLLKGPDLVKGAT